MFGLMVLLDAYIAMIPKTDGDATPLGQRPLSVLPVVYRIWASARMGQLDGWFKSWVPDSVFSAGGGRGSVEAWYTSSLDIEEVLAGATDSHVHLFVADVVKSFDTVDRTRKGVRGGPLLDIHGSLQLLNFSHVRERDKALLRTIMVGGVWNGFLLGRVRGQAVPCRFCGAPDSDGHLFWDCPFPPLVEIRENPEFHDIMRLDKAHWPRCLLWHGWLPMLSGVNGASPWALDASESAAYLVEVALGRCSSGLIAEWNPSDDFDHDMAASSLPDHPDVWTDGSLVLDRLTGVSTSGSWFFCSPG